MRKTGAPFFLGDTAFLSDGRFRALARRLPDPDDFNSAVGAWFIALAAARRNGKPDLDVDAETESKFTADLRAVGLLEEGGFRPDPFHAWAPMRPQQALAGQARASSGKRDSGGRFVPSNEPTALVPLDQRYPASLPFPSSQRNGEESLRGEPEPLDPDMPKKVALAAGGFVAAFGKDKSA